MGSSTNGPVLPASLLASLYPRLSEGKSLDDLLRHVCNRVSEALVGADVASVTLFTDGRAKTYGATADLALAVDEAQYEAGGPCVDAAQSNHVVLVSDLATETRWAAAPLMAALGVGSLLAMPLPVQDESIGSLNVYSRRPNVFDNDTIGLASELASHAGVAVYNAVSFHTAAEQARQLRKAMESRAVIEQAKGILIATTGTDADEAFNVLVQQSRHENRKLREIAAELVARNMRAPQRQFGGLSSPGG